METLSIGRAPDNDLVLASEKVSRYHARLYKRAGRWVLVDLQSTHGTSVNGEKVDAPIKLRPSDKLLISDVKLYFDGSNIRSAEGKSMVSLTDSGQKEQSVLSSHTSARKQDPFSSTVLAVLGITAVLLLFAGIIVTLSGSGTEEPVEATPTTSETSEPEAVIAYGTIQYEGGEYTGWMRNGLPHGQGTISYSAAERTSSFYDVLIRRDVQEKVYEGEWKHGRKHGYGTMIQHDGSTLEGYWENDNYIGPRGN